jgi:hypothetical protein
MQTRQGPLYKWHPMMPKHESAPMSLDSAGAALLRNT